MTVKKLVRPYRTGHCTGNASGGHQRCPHVVTATITCACECHTPPTTEDREAA